MDPSLWVAFASIATATVTGFFGYLGVKAINRREAENAAVAAARAEQEKAEQKLEEATAERFKLRDEQIAALERQRDNRDRQLQEAAAAMADKDARNAAIVLELADAVAERDRLRAENKRLKARLGQNRRTEDAAES